MDCLHPNIELLHCGQRFICPICGLSFTPDEVVEVLKKLNEVVDHHYDDTHPEEQTIDNFFETRKVTNQ